MTISNLIPLRHEHQPGSDLGLFDVLGICFLQNKGEDIQGNPLGILGPADDIERDAEDKAMIAIIECA